MGRFGTFLFGLVVGAAIVYGTQRYHVVRTSEGFYAIPKISATFAGVFVDVRDFGPSDWIEHRELAAAMIKANKQHLITGSATDSAAEQIKSGLQKALDSVTEEGS